MKKIEIVLTFSEEKLEVLEFSLRKERSSVQKKMDEALKNLYEQTVPRRCGSTWTGRTPLFGSGPGVRPGSRRKPSPPFRKTEVKAHEKSAVRH